MNATNPADSSLALLTDLYQLTMAYGYWRAGLAERRAVFHLFYRREPFRGGYAIAAGLGPMLEELSRWHFDTSDLDYLATLRGNDGAPLFDEGFLRFLGDARFACDLDAVSEGTVVFAHEPLVRVEGPLWQAQVIETALLNTINFQTLIATKAARVVESAAGESVLEFGLRRAQGIDGAMAASRAAYIGGVAATSNVLAGKRFGIPVKGTHAHSWVMAFGTEREAFDAYADAMPHNSVLLVDTYDTLRGVEIAIEVGRTLRQRGHDLAGVRLDSGDLAYLSIEARKLLDAAGFEKTAIVASNDLDEHLIANLKSQGAKIGVWGVGTNLVTAADQPALGGVYKLAAMAQSDAEDPLWDFKVKLSEQPIKVSNPGKLTVWRYEAEGQLVGDVIADADSPMQDAPRVHGIEDPLATWELRGATASNLLEPVMRAGTALKPSPTLTEIREHAVAQRAQLSARTRRFVNPQPHPVGLSTAVHQRKLALIEAARRGNV